MEKKILSYLIDVDCTTPATPPAIPSLIAVLYLNVDDGTGAGSTFTVPLVFDDLTKLLCVEMLLRQHDEVFLDDNQHIRYRQPTGSGTKVRFHGALSAE